MSESQISARDPESPYRPLRRRARWTVGLLAAGVLVDSLAVWFGLSERAILDRIAAGETVTESETSASDTRIAIIAFSQGIVFTLTATAFLAWFYRAYRNLEAFQIEGLRYGRRWAVASWFVPILNLWRPKQAINDIWRASDPAEPTGEHNTSWRDGSVPVLFAFWWAAWLISQWLYNVSFRQAFGAEGVAELREVNGFTLAADGIAVIAALLCIPVVLRLTERQERRAASLGLTPEEVTTPVYRRGSAWALLGAVVLAFGAQGALGVAAALTSVDTTDPATAESPEPSDPTLLAEDDFSDPKSGWVRQHEQGWSMDYVGNAYQITVAKKQREEHAYMDFTEPQEELRVSVEATLVEGGRFDGYGLGCWVGTEAGYYTVVLADGSYAITKDPAAAGPPEELAFGRAARRVGGKGMTNNLEFECRRESGVAELVLRVNGSHLKVVRDSRPLSSITGVGMFAYSDSGSTKVRFDDLVVRKADA